MNIVHLVVTSVGSSRTLLGHTNTAMFSDIFGRSLRGLAGVLERTGRRLQGANAPIENLMPSTRVVAVGGKELQHGLEAFVAPTSNVIGDVQLGERSSVWYGATVRGESNKVTIGNGSCVQDRAVVDATGGASKIGNDVSIGAGAYVGAATLSDGVLVGPGAVVNSGVHVGSDSYIDGGATIPNGTRIGAGELWTGSPAKKLRNLTESEVAFLRGSAQHTAQCAETHFEQSIQTGAGLEAQEAEREVRAGAFLKWNDKLPQDPEELVQYNRLSYNPHDVGLFRAQDYDEPAEWQALEEEEDKIDEEIDAHAAEYAIMDRVNDAVEEILGAHPARVAEIKAQLRDRDAKAADILDSMMAEVERACDNEDAARALEAAIQSTRPSFGRAPAEEAQA